MDIDERNESNFEEMDTLGDKATNNYVPKTRKSISQKTSTIEEKEAVVFLKILDFSQLKTASSSEKQEQWGIPAPKSEQNAGAGVIRCRKIIYPNGEKKFELTTKIFNSKNTKYDTRFESTVLTDEENFILFKFLSGTGFIKHRYCFPVENTDLKWEVDVAPDGKGGYCPWVRAEIELSDPDGPLPDLPLKAEEVILPKGMDQQYSEEEWNEKTKKIMDNFKIQNVYIKGSDNTDTSEKNLEEPDKEKEENEKISNDNGSELDFNDVTDDPKKAEQVIEKAKKIEESKDDKLEDETEDKEIKEEDEEEAKKAVKNGMESLVELVALRNYIVSNETLTEKQYKQIFNKLSEINETVGIPNNGMSLESFCDKANMNGKEVALESVVSSMTKIANSLTNWFTNVYSYTKDLFRKYSNNFHNLELRCADRLKKLKNPNLKISEGVSVKYNLEKFSIDGKFNSLSNSVKNQYNFISSFFSNHSRISIYKELVDKLLLLELDVLDLKEWDEIKNIKIVPNNGWFLVSSKPNGEETWGKLHVSNSIWTITKFISKDISEFNLKFKDAPLKVADTSPDWIVIENKDVYIDLLTQVMDYSKKINSLENEISQYLGTLKDVTNKKISFITAMDPKSSEKITISPAEIVKLTETVLDYIFDETSIIMKSWHELINNVVDCVDVVIKESEKTSTDE